MIQILCTNKIIPKGIINSTILKYVLKRRFNNNNYGEVSTTRTESAFHNFGWHQFM